MLFVFPNQFDDGGGLDQPFLSSNLDFTGQTGFADLIDADGLIAGMVEDDRPIARSMIYTDPTTGAVFGIVVMLCSTLFALLADG